MPPLMELVKLPVIAKQTLIDALEILATNGKDLGYVEARDVVAALGKTQPELSRADLERLKVACRGASTHLDHDGRSNAAQDWARILDAVEAKLDRLPR